MSAHIDTDESPPFTSVRLAQSMTMSCAFIDSATVFAGASSRELIALELTRVLSTDEEQRSDIDAAERALQERLVRAKDGPQVQPQAGRHVPRISHGGRVDAFRPRVRDAVVYNLPNEDRFYSMSYSAASGVDLLAASTGNAVTLVDPRERIAHATRFANDTDSVMFVRWMPDAQSTAAAPSCIVLSTGRSGRVNLTRVTRSAPGVASVEPATESAAGGADASREGVDAALRSGQLGVDVQPLVQLEHARVVCWAAVLMPRGNSVVCALDNVGLSRVVLERNVRRRAPADGLAVHVPVPKASYVFVGKGCDALIGKWAQWRSEGLVRVMVSQHVGVVLHVDGATLTKEMRAPECTWFRCAETVRVHTYARSVTPDLWPSEVSQTMRSLTVSPSGLLAAFTNEGPWLFVCRVVAESASSDACDALELVSVHYFGCDAQKSNWGTLWTAEFSPCSRFLALASWKAHCGVLDVASGELVMDAHDVVKEALLSTAWSPLGDALVAVGWDRLVSVIRTPAVCLCEWTEDSHCAMPAAFRALMRTLLLCWCCPDTAISELPFDLVPLIAAPLLRVAVAR